MKPVLTKTIECIIVHNDKLNGKDVIVRGIVNYIHQSDRIDLKLYNSGHNFYITVEYYNSIRKKVPKKWWEILKFRPKYEDCYVKFAKQMKVIDYREI